MLVDLIPIWGQQANIWILGLFHYIFPEYPKSGLAVFITAAIFFVYYLVQKKPAAALKMAVSTILVLSFVLFAIHCLIKVYHVVL
jgi:hypothetical protein